MAIRKYSKAFLFSTTFLLAGLHLGNWVDNDSGFRVQKVMVTGCKVLSEREVLAAAKVPLHQSIFDIEFAPIAKRVQALPFVRQVQVSRTFPSTLVIAVQERKPVALINNAGLWPVDEEGVIMPRLSSLSLIKSSHEQRHDRHGYDPEMFDIPVLSGISFIKAKDGKKLSAPAKRLLDFLITLRATNTMLYHSISELSINSSENLSLYLMDGGVPVYLGRDGWLEKCDRLFIFLRHVRPAPGKLIAIDLRYENQIVIRES